MRTIVAAALACAVVLPPGVARADTAIRRTVERSAPAAAHVRIEDAVGDVQVVGDDGTTVRVTARIRATSDEAANTVGVDLTRSGDETVVVVNFPHRSSGIWQLLDKGRISVDLKVSVPRGSALIARITTGDLDVRGVAAAIDAHSSTGDIHLRDVATDASAISSTGDVAVELVAGWHGARLTANTRTGDVRIRASRGLRAHVDAHSRVGDVHNALGSADVASPVIEARTSVGDVIISTR